ncbi:PREDICTED: transmembrane protein FAM155A-like [Galeopterus variegatus]|uniref:Transmembrane protein FAM155A-like n=1 Tax=Galeopterus variegatus TaxID=482537 RepID=A0ABM0RJA2_GALVR|nr:PREDICTED: transmembrane protein FAM155A-like [Galeopterus variegatus]
MMKSSTEASPVSSVQAKVKFTFECLRRNEYWLYETFLTNDEPECCDVRREEQSNNPSKGTVEKSDSCHRTSLTVSSATRLCNSRLKLCVLVLILLHTVLTASAAQNTTALSLGGLNTLEENSTNEE